MPISALNNTDVFRLLVTSVIDYAIFMLDVDGYVRTWNEGAERITGYSAAEILEQHFSVLYTEEDRRRHHDKTELRLALEQTHYEEEGWRVRKGGSLFWANVVITALFEGSELVGFAKVTRDLTEKKLAEERLRATERKLAAALDAGKIGIMEIDLETGVCSSTFDSVLRGASIIALDDLFALIMPEEHEYARAKFRAAASADMLEMECRTKIDGEVKWLNWKGSRVPCTSRFLVTVIDVSERRIEEEKARELALLKEREDFISTLAHDMKNPLIGANRLLDLLIDDRVGTVQPEQKRLLSCLKESNEGALELIHNLVDAYRWDSSAYELQLAETDMKEMAFDLVRRLKQFAELRGITVVVDAPNTDVVCLCDQRAMKRVVKNLLDNALKFSPQHGHVTVRLTVSPQSLFISVADNGPGVKAEDQNRLFGRFSQGETGKRHEGGSGLGLYLCRKIVEGHLGRISCVSAVGAGTIFMIQLPRALASTQLQEPA